MSPRWRLTLAAAVFLGWLGWLGYAALTKSRGPIVSHAQAAAARHQIVAELKTGDDGKLTGWVTVVESLTPDGPATGTAMLIPNLLDAAGFEGPGQYLLLLSGDGFMQLVEQQRSPGNDVSGFGKPLIYRWSDDVRKQAAKLRR